MNIKTAEDIAQFKISTRLLMEEALRKGYELSYFRSSPATQSGITRAVKNGKEFFFKSTLGAVTPSYGVFAAENKVLTHSLLSAYGVPVPDTIALGEHDTLEQAQAFMAQYGKVVVKPADANHGDGVSINVDDDAKLEKAVAFARAQAVKEPDVIVQEQVTGDEYRFLVVSGRVVAVASRRQPFVIGDGEHTVKQLIDVKNLDPRRGDGHSSELTKINIEDVRHHRSDEFLEKIPQRDELVTVLDTSNLSKGGESIDLTDVAAPALKQMAVEAAERCFLGVAGVDIMTDSISEPGAGNSYVIEVNLTPGIRMHEFPGQGEARQVSRKIFAAFEKNARAIDRRVIPIGRSEKIAFPDFEMKKVPARVDTGATVSSIWASNIQETTEGLTFTLFDEGSEFYTGEKIVVDEYDKRAVSSSMGHTQIRFTVMILISLHGRRIRAKFTLADRSTQIYPVLIGRNVLRNKFIVDVAGGKPISTAEKAHRAKLDELLKGGNV